MMVAMVAAAAPAVHQMHPPYSASAPPSAHSVRLSPDERQIARASGMSDVDYARNKLELERRRAAGLLQDRYVALRRLRRASRAIEGRIKPGCGVADRRSD
jgi:hypothetical protein